VLERLSDANRVLDLYKEGIQQAKEGLEVFEQLGDTVEQAECLNTLGWLLCDDRQFDAAEAAVSRAFDLLPEKGNQFLVCRCHRGLGDIFRSKGDKEKAIHHYETALGVASSFDWHNELFWNHYFLAWLLSDQDRLDEANVHTEHAKSHVVNNQYHLGHTMYLQAKLWYQQRRFDEARSEVLRATDLYKKLGAVQELPRCKLLLMKIVSEGE